MDCAKPVRLKSGLLVPCGKCLGCRIQKRREWSLRCLHELEVNNNEAVFVTLTYNNDNLPMDRPSTFIQMHIPYAPDALPTLRKKDLQLFFKRLRKLCSNKIRYFACGEYGDESQRPHYHAIIFGLPFTLQTKKYIMQSWSYCDWNIDTIRNKGIRPAEPLNIQYVCRYVDKKFTGDLAKDEYDNKGREPVFKINSLGIGRAYCDKYYSQIKDNMRLTVNGVNHSIPRYYIQRLDLDISKIQESMEIENEKRFEKITNVKHLNKCNARDDINEFYRNEMKYKKSVSSSLKQHNQNLNAKVNLKKRNKI